MKGVNHGWDGGGVGRGGMDLMISSGLTRFNSSTADCPTCITFMTRIKSQRESNWSVDARTTASKCMIHATEARIYRTHCHTKSLLANVSYLSTLQ